MPTDTLANLTHLPEGEQLDLKAILESTAQCGALAHYTIANILYRAFPSATPAQKKILAAEIFCKLMQTVEDYGANCLIWETSAQINPLRKYFNIQTKQIINFFRRPAHEPPFDSLRIIWGIAIAVDAVANGKLQQCERKNYDGFVDKFLREVAARLLNIRDSLFAQSSTAKTQTDYGDMVNMYFNAKHGVKIFFNTRSAKHLNILDDHLSVAIGPGQILNEATSRLEESLIIGRFPLTTEILEHILKMTESVGQNLSTLAQMRRDWLDDRFYFVKVFHLMQNQGGELLT